MSVAPSKNFTLEEWVRSANHPQLQIPLHDLGLTRAINSMRLTLLFMQPTRGRVGTLDVLSWCRSLELNSAVGGVDDSDHLLGLACDFAPRAVPTQLVFDLALSGELANVGAEWDKLNIYTDRDSYHVALRPVEAGPSRGRVYRNWERVA